MFTAAAKPPTDEEKYSYTNANGLLFSIPGFLLLTCFSVSTFYFIKKSPLLIPYLLFSLIYVLNLAFSTFGALFSVYLDTEEHDKLRDSNKNYEPSVDVYLPNCGEPIQILANTFRAVAALDYINYKVWVLDDAGRDEVRMLAELHGFEYIARANKGYLKKAGNMRNAFAVTEGEFIAVFDADFVPRKDYLRETIFYMRSGEIAILQTPQYFQIENGQTSIQKGATYIQEVFHRLIQNFRNQWGSSVCTGSCAIYRRAALAPVGGAFPVERSEDVNTGMYVLRQGWKIKYLPLVLSAGLSPDTVKAFFHQQYRWCSGSLHLITSPLFWQQENVGILGKLSYTLSIFYYLCSGLGAVLFSLPSLINVWFFPQDFEISNYSLIAPALLACLFMRGLWSKHKWTFDVMLTTFAASYCHLTAIFDVLAGDVQPWVPTGSTSAATTKKNNYGKFKKLVLTVPIANVTLFMGGLYFNRYYIDLSSLSIVPISIWYSVQLWLQFFLCKQILSEERQSKSI
jgi:cellulose synthase (UDP-forming)